MRRLQPDNYKKLMPLKRIAEASSYSFGYVSILVQRKKLKAKKIGNKYYSTQEWFDQYLELHARDIKRLPEEVTKELSSGQTSSLKPASESIASAKLKNHIDNLVERAINDRFTAQAEQKKIISSAAIAKDKEERKWIAGHPPVPSGHVRAGARNGKTTVSLPVVKSVPEEKKLAEILNHKIASSDIKFIADFVEPETRLEIKWQENLNQEAKDLLKQQSIIASKIKTEARIEARAALKQKIKAVIFAAALLANAITEKLTSLTNALKSRARNASLAVRAGLVHGVGFFAARALKAVAGKFSNAGALKYFRIAGQAESDNFRMVCQKLEKNIAKAILSHQLLLKTAAVTLVIALAIISLNRFAPGAATGFNQMAGKIFSGALSQARELANRGLKSKYLTQVGEPIEKAKKLPENSNVIIPGGALAAKVKTSVDNLLLNMADSLSAASLKFENNLRRRNQILAARLGRVKDQVLFITGFWQEESAQNLNSLKLAARLLPVKAVGMGRQSLLMLTSFLNFQGQSIGQVAFLTIEKSSLPPFPPERLFSRAGVKGGAKQGRVAGAAEASNNYQPMFRLLALANTTSRRGQEVLNQIKYNTANVLENTSVRQKELSLNLGRKLAKFTLASAKGVGLVSQTGQIKLARLENTISQTNQSIQQTGQAVQEYNDNGQKYLASEAGRSLWSLSDLYSKFIDRIIPDSLKNKYASLYQTPPTIVERETIVKEITVVKEGTQPVQNITYNVKSPQPPLLKGADTNLSITGNADIGGYLNVSGPTTLKDKLTVSGPSEFLGDVVVNAALTAKTLLVTDYAQFAGTINAQGIMANTLTARDSLTVVGDSFIGGNELIRGNLAVSGTFSAGHTEFPSLGVTGQLGAESLSAGSGGLVVSGNTYFSGPVDLDEILDIDINSGSALTVGDGSTDTFTVDTNNDIVTIAARLNLSGNLALTGDLDLNGALDLDVASTSALAIGDGADNNLTIDTINDIITLGYASTTDQITINNSQLTINSASTTTAVLINYGGTGNIMQILDNAVDRFTMAGLGVTSLTASSTVGTALTITQNDTGDILNLFDGANEVLTILDGGNVGIGTTSPWMLLTVGSSTPSQIVSANRYNSAYVSGDFEVDGTAYLDGGMVLGGTATTTGDLIPSVDNTYDIGSASYRWRTGYFGTSVGIGGGATTTSNQLAFAGASTLQTLTGGLTITGAEASTWSTTAGLLTLSGASGITNTSTGGTYTVNAANQTIDLDSTTYNLDTTGATALTSVGALTLDTSSTFTASSTGAMILKGDTFIASSTGTMAFWTGNSRRLTILSGGNVGIGSTTPYAKLAIVGNTYFTGDHYQQGNATTTGFYNIGQLFSVSGTGTSTIDSNLWVKDTLRVGTGSIYLNDTSVSAANGAFAFNTNATSTFSTYGLTIGTNQFVVQQTSGNVGIGTTSPLYKLSIQGTAGQDIFNVASSTGQSLLSVSNTGQCVTGDTLLTVVALSVIASDQGERGNLTDSDADQRLPRRPSAGLLAMTKQVRIDNIRGGEYVLSLNEKTGKLVPAKIKGLLDMGVKPIYKITTEDGKTIRTTANHPYLTRLDSARQAKQEEDLGIFGMMKKNQPEKNQQDYAHDNVESKITHNNLFISAVNDNNIADNENNADYNVSDKEIVHNFELDNNFSPSNRVNTAKIIPEEKVSRLKSLPAMPGAKMETKVEPTSNLDKSIKYSEVFSSWDSVNFISNNNYSNDNNDLSNAVWTKVAELSAGDEIAVADSNTPFNKGGEGDLSVDIKFVRIAKIELLPAEQVYDIEVEGTHNFVANGIIAHNTYIYGNTGIGSTTPGYKLSVAGDIYADGNLIVSGLTA
ncbi:MAG: hypothetical protein ABIB72_03615, partial [Candidatus Falkowbacteria bacterium]